MVAQKEKTAVRLIDVEEVAARCGVKSARTIRRWYGAYGKDPLVPDFPKPIRIGGVDRWRDVDLDKYLRDYGATAK